MKLFYLSKVCSVEGTRDVDFQFSTNKKKDKRYKVFHFGRKGGYSEELQYESNGGCKSVCAPRF